MKAVIDANVLMQLLGVIGNGLTCPRTNVAIDKLELRADALVNEFTSAERALCIPAPVLAEVLTKIEPEHHQAYVDQIDSITCLQILPFDQKCAIECARLFDAQEARQLKRERETKAKIAVDRQVIAISIVNGPAELWTHDKKMLRKAERSGLTVKSFADVEPLPVQSAMAFSDPAHEKASGDEVCRRHVSIR